MPAGKGTYGNKVGRPKKQGQKDREDEKLAMEVKGLKNKAQKKTMRKGGGGGWLAHVRKVRKPGESWKAALKRASASYKK